MSEGFVIITRAGHTGTYDDHEYPGDREGGDINGTATCGYTPPDEGCSVVASWYAAGGTTYAKITKIDDTNCGDDDDQGKVVEITFYAVPASGDKPIGRVQYVHIEPAGGLSVGQTITSGTTVGVIGGPTVGGYVHKTDCWTGPHLHQDQFLDPTYGGKLVDLVNDNDSVTQASTFIAYIDAQLS